MEEQETADQELENYLVSFKNFNLLRSWANIQFLETLDDLEIRDSDIFIITYPKSGTIWTQQIVNLIVFDEHRNGTENVDNMERVLWIEYSTASKDFGQRPSPRVFSSHLPYYLMPKALRNKKGKVIYVYRNPKDTMTSFYHFAKILGYIKPEVTMENFMERFLAGNVASGLWFDHVRGWFTHEHDFNLLFMSYEEMKKDLRNAVLKISKFLGKKLTDEEVESVVKQATFQNMINDSRANYNRIKDDIIQKQVFLRKGIIGDWKNALTVAQNEKFDKIFQEKMEQQLQRGVGKWSP
uniref:Sulfotransferase n=1 Tax=Ornithorhynchus anatinus TaxID=9258 RepID=F6U8N1_ORNAN